MLQYMETQMINGELDGICVLLLKGGAHDVIILLSRRNGVQAFPTRKSL